MMKVKQIKESNQIKVYIETSQEYSEDYQLKMLKKSEVAGLIPLKCQSIDNKSNFVYDVSNMLSLKRRFEAEDLNFSNLYEFVKALLEILEEIEKYLLNPDALVLEPGLIYWDYKQWNFLYLPAKKSNLNRSFHDLTEYFVKTLDYSEVESIKFANFLHKETLLDNFVLEEVFEKYEEYDRKYELLETKGEKRNPISINEDTGWVEDEEDREEAVEKIAEKAEEKTKIEAEERKGNFNFGGFHKSREKSRKKLRKSLWGDWQDMIVE